MTREEREGTYLQFEREDGECGARLKIYAVACVVEADYKEADIRLRGAVDNEANATHSITWANEPTWSGNLAQWDAISWRVTDAILNLLKPGDSVEVLVYHEVATEPGNCDTNANIRCAILEVL